MIEVDVTTNKDGYMTVETRGHAHRDICASVSTLLQSQVNYLVELSHQFPKEIKVVIKEEKE